MCTSLEDLLTKSEEFVISGFVPVILLSVGVRILHNHAVVIIIIINQSLLPPSSSSQHHHHHIIFLVVRPEWGKKGNGGTTQ
jgi:hypothetical protein